MDYTLKHLGINIHEFTDELWRYVTGTNQRYLVSNYGRLLTTGYKNTKKPAIMNPAKDASGYLRTVLKIDGKLKTVKVHRIVAKEWVKNHDDNLVVNHIDFDRSNNKASNLEWCTLSENAKHSYKHGRIKKPICTNFVKGSKVGTSKLTEEQVIEIRKKFKPRVYTRQMLADEYGVSHHTIKDVILRRWKHV